MAADCCPMLASAYPVDAFACVVLRYLRRQYRVAGVLAQMLHGGTIVLALIMRTAGCAASGQSANSEATVNILCLRNSEAVELVVAVDCGLTNWVLRHRGHCVRRANAYPRLIC